MAKFIVSIRDSGVSIEKLLEEDIDKAIAIGLEQIRPGIGENIVVNTVLDDHYLDRAELGMMSLMLRMLPPSGYWPVERVDRMKMKLNMLISQ